MYVHVFCVCVCVAADALVGPAWVAGMDAVMVVVLLLPPVVLVVVSLASVCAQMRRGTVPLAAAAGGAAWVGDEEAAADLGRRESTLVLGDALKEKPARDGVSRGMHRGGIQRGTSAPRLESPRVRLDSQEEKKGDTDGAGGELHLGESMRSPLHFQRN